jgi:hypothetical protein
MHDKLIYFLIVHGRYNCEFPGFFKRHKSTRLERIIKRRETSWKMSWTSWTTSFKRRGQPRGQPRGPPRGPLRLNVVINPNVINAVYLSRYKRQFFFYFN